MPASHFVNLKRRLALAAPILLPTLLPGYGRAQEVWPSKPVTIIVPQAAGGANDTVARAFGQRLAAAIGQPVVIENRTGAGGNVGTVAAARVMTQ